MPYNANFCTLEPIESLTYCPLLRKHSKFFPILGFLHVFFRDLNTPQLLFSSPASSLVRSQSQYYSPFETFDQKSKQLFPFFQALNIHY